MSDEDVPPAGTPCAPCRAGGHFCQTKKWAGKTDVALCDPCAFGVDCARFAAVKLVTEGSDEFVFESEPMQPAPPPVISIQPDKWSEDDRVKQSTTDTEDFRAANPWMGRQRISDETKAHIIAEPLTISNIQLERKYKISVQTIGKIRRAAGMITEGMKGGIHKAERASIPREVKLGMPREEYRISDEIRKAIAQEPLEIRDFEIGQKYGCSAASVHTIRIAAGLDVPLRPRGPEKGTGAGKKRGPYRTTQSAQFEEGNIVDVDKESQNELARSEAAPQYKPVADQSVYEMAIIEMERELAIVVGRAVLLRRAIHAGKAVMEMFTPKIPTSIHKDSS